MKTQEPNPSKASPTRDRLAYLEEAHRHTLDALDMAASLGLPEGGKPLGTVTQVLKETTSKLRGLLSFKAMAFFLVKEPGGEFLLARCQPPALAARMEEEMRLLAENGQAAWALQRQRPVITTPSGSMAGEGELLLHSLATASRIRGMFLGLTTQDARTLNDTALALTTIVIRSCASLLEGLELYGLLRQANAELTARVRELEESRRSLTREIENRRKIEEALKQKALHDPLTGLPNRTLVRDRIRQAMHRAKRQGSVHYAVAFMDLDRFKEINDTLGHAVGDKLLAEVGRRLVESVRQMDTVSRIGGDEFVIFLEELSSPGEALQVMRRVRLSLDQPFDLGGQEAHVSGSIGLAFGGERVRSPERLIKNADTAMLHAKQAGRNRIKVYNARMHRDTTENGALLAGARRAVESGRVGVLYRPALSPRDLSLLGFEAVPVWTSKDKGVFQGEKLARLCAKADVGGLLFEATLRKALADMSVWWAADGSFAHLAVSLRLSASLAASGEPAEAASPAGEEVPAWPEGDFEPEDAPKAQPAGHGEVFALADAVRRAIEEAELPASALHLDISGEVLAGGDAAANLAALSRLGVRLGLGGFGERFYTVSGEGSPSPEARGEETSRRTAEPRGKAHGGVGSLASVARVLGVAAKPGGACGKDSSGTQAAPAGVGLEAGTLARLLTSEEVLELVGRGLVASSIGSLPRP